MHWLKEFSWRLVVGYFALIYGVAVIADSNPSKIERATSAQTVFTGSWHSPEWKYGFRIENDKGYVTTWNNDYNPEDPTSAGDIVLHITEFLPNGFKGIHIFYDGSRIEVIAQIIDKNTIELSGRREIWKMYREEVIE